MRWQRAEHDFPGGLIVEQFKELVCDQPILDLPLPARLRIDLRQAAGPLPDIIVNEGDQVAKGEVLARCPHGLAPSLHAPAAGRIEAILESVDNDSGEPGPAISLLTHSDVAENQHDRTPPQQSASDLRTTLRDGGIVGLGGAAFPSHVKMAEDLPRIETIIVNAAECEPYIACDEGLVRERAQAVIEGADCLRRAADAAQVIIAVESSRQGMRQALDAAVGENVPPWLSLRAVADRYPEGGERQLIQSLTGQEVPADGLPRDLGVICLNVATIIAARDLILDNQPLTHRIISVTGAGVRSPRNIRAPIGTPLRELIAACDGYTEKAARLLMGGPLSGRSLAHDDHSLRKGSNCLLVMTSDQLRDPAEEHACIRCMDCVPVCPAGLLPQQLLFHIQAENWDEVAEHNLDACIECGCCAEVCPSQIPLVAHYALGKASLREQERERAQAALAQRRFEAREQRLQQEQARLNARREAAQRKLEEARQSPTAKQDAVAAAVARARAKKRKPRE